jgi:hypothetical protein
MALCDSDQHQRCEPTALCADTATAMSGWLASPECNGLMGSWLVGLRLGGALFASACDLEDGPQRRA